MNYNSQSNNKNYLICLIKGLSISYVITVIFFILLAIILTYTNLNERIIPVVDSIIMIISIALGAIYTAIKLGKKGWLNGAVVGLGYMIILLILRQVIFSSVQFNLFTIGKVFIAVIIGAVGGMIGINIK